jgi:hypothetical protein
MVNPVVNPELLQLSSRLSRARLRRARPSGPGRFRTRRRKIIGGLRELTRGQGPEPSGTTGTAPTPGWAACRALRTGALRARRRH